PQLVERAAVVRMQQVQQLAPTGIGESLEQHVGVIALSHVQYASDYLRYDRQVVACVSSVGLNPPRVPRMSISSSRAHPWHQIAKSGLSRVIARNVDSGSAQTSLGEGSADDADH